jgi:hypothetical protein
MRATGTSESCCLVRRGSGVLSRGESDLGVRPIIHRVKTLSMDESQ